MLQDIVVGKTFDLACRLVACFDEGNGMALWVQDGTRCPLFTSSDSMLQPYNSQETQDICNNCLTVCVRSRKSLLNDINLVPKQTLIYLRNVQTSISYCSPSVGDVVLFEVKGSVELLDTTCACYHSLVERLSSYLEVSQEPVVEELVQPTPSLPNFSVNMDISVTNQGSVTLNIRVANMAPILLLFLKSNIGMHSTTF